MIPLPLSPKIIKEEKNSALFEIEALYPGYGTTIGNALRRVLYSSLEGAAITQVKIKGVQHEFSTLAGVLEDVLTICFNLKQIRFKLNSDRPQSGSLKVKGERKVKAQDLKLPPEVQLVNKEAPIATLTERKASLELEVTIEKGIGYQPVEARKPKGKLEIGVIPIDAIFTPIRRVRWHVENMRVGARTDFDRLQIEIETDGSASPKEAFSKACQILINHFNLLKEPFEEKKVKLEKKALPVKKKRKVRRKKKSR